MSTSLLIADNTNSSAAAPLNPDVYAPCDTYASNSGFLQIVGGKALGNVVVQRGGSLSVNNDGLVNGMVLAGQMVTSSAGDAIRGGSGLNNSVTIAGGGVARGVLTGANTTLNIGDTNAQAQIGFIKSGGTTTITNTLIAPSLKIGGIPLATQTNGEVAVQPYNAGLLVNAGTTTVSNSTIDAPSNYGVTVTPDATRVAGTAAATTTLNMTGTTITANAPIMVVNRGTLPTVVNITNSHATAILDPTLPAFFGYPAGIESAEPQIGGGGAPATITLIDSDFHGSTGMTMGGLTANMLTVNAAGSTFESTLNTGDLGSGTGAFLNGAANVTLDKSAAGNISTVSGLTDGILIDTPDLANQAPTLRLLNGTVVTGKNGAAIHVQNRAGGALVSNILIASGSTLTGSNGNILQVDTAGKADVTADGVNLKGNSVVTGASSQLSLGLNNNAAITGDFNASAGGTLVIAPVDASTSVFNLTGNVNADAATATVGLGANGVLNGAVTAQNGSTLSVQGTGAQARLSGPIRVDASTASVQLSGGAQASGGVALTNGATGSQILVDGAGSLLSNGGNTAISVDGTGTSANIYLQNGGRLDAAAGNPLVNVTNAALANVTLDNTTQTGDLTQDATSKLNVTLQNNATLTGNLATSSLAVNSGSTWRVGNQVSQSVGDLSMNGGTIDFNSGTGPFKVVTASSLNGSGNLNMAVDFKPGATNDQLNVDGQANGSFGINANAQDQGVQDPRNNIPMVFTQGGNAQFAILADGGKVDAGIYTYTLQKAGDDWVLVRNGTQPVPPPDPTNPAAPTPEPTPTPTVGTTPAPAPAPLPAPEDLSPAAKTALSMSAALPYAFYGELATLRQRQGDLRMNKTDSGLWARSYSTFNQIAKSAAPPFQLNQYGGSLGADKRFLLSSGDLYVGGFGSYSYNTLDIDGGSTGRINSYGGGVYATWMLSNGWYLDSVLKANNFDNELRVVGSNGSNARGKYSTPGFGGSIELGKHIDIGNKGFIEPYMQWAGFVAKSANETLDNNFRAQYGTTKSVQGQIGMLAGSNFEFKNGVIVQPYIKGAMIREFMNNNKVTLNGTQFTQDMSGNRMLVGLGVATQIKPNLQVHLDADYSTGGPVNNSTNINFGVRYAF